MNRQSTHQHRSIGNRFSRFVMPFWAIGILAVTSSLMAGHWVTLPHPHAGERLPSSVIRPIVSSGNSIASEGNEALVALHILYGDCPCSRRVLQHVLARQPLAGVRERIVLVGKSLETQNTAESMGYEVDVITASELTQKYGVEAAPLLVVVNRNAEILYSGGYTSRKQSLDISDVAIIADVMSGSNVDAMPLYGCAVSKGLKAIIDPLNLKNLSENP